VTTPTGEKSPYDDAYAAWQKQQSQENAYARHWGGLPYTSAGMENVYGLSGGLGGSLGGLASGPAYSSARLKDLQRTIVELQHQLGALNAYAQHMEAQLHAVRSQAAQQHEATRMHLDHILKHLIGLAHPDKWPGNPLAHEITVALNRMREEKYRSV
jgi:hypothetical protein